jgi:serpin B
MAATLHFDLPQCRLHPAFNALEEAVTHPAAPGKGADGGAFHLDLASALFDQVGYPIAVPFLDTLAVDHGAELHVVDFLGAPESARKAINTWMGDHSGQWIDSVLQPGSILPTTRMVLGNAVFFSAAWKTPFKSSDTRFAAFTRRDGSVVEVPTMTATQNLAYGEGQGYSAVQLPYDAGDLSMILLLPPQGGLDALESSLSPERLTSIVAGLEERTVAIELPTFKVESSLGLGDALGRLGMPNAFSDAADFSGMSGVPGLSLDEVVHQTFVDVDEAGTEAAAATATGFTATAAFLPAEIRFERPYLFLVRDNVTGTVLFLGRVDDPTP